MSLVSLENGVAQAIHLVLAGNDAIRPIRIELRSTGCCDASLGLFLDDICEFDLIQKVEDLTFIARPEINDLVGEITIGCRGSGFVLTAEHPMSEWDGFGVCHIKK